MRIVLTAITFSILFKTVVTLIAYDCGHDRMNRTAITLLGVEKCNITEENIQHEQEDIQLLELNEVTSIHIYQCKINVLQTVYHCGMFSHLSVVSGGLSTFIAEISQEDCMKIHQHGIYKLQNNRIIANIKANASTRHTETVTGSIDANGNCDGAAYTYGANSWTKVVVIHAMEITIADYTGTLRLEDNQVILRNNILCSYIKGRCLDPEDGMSFWELIPDKSCEALSYTVLYQGNATKTQNLDTMKQETQIVYNVSTGEVIFALEVIKPIYVCRYKGFQTEHPRLVIVSKSFPEYLFHKKSAFTKNLDLFTYVNAKFVYVERHIKTQIQTLYTHLIYKKCEIEREVLQTQLAVAHHHPTEFALMRMKEQGYTAISRGEIIYLIKCQAVEVTIRKTDRCYNELPVNYNNQSFFMTPITHLLIKYGNEVPCSSILPPAYLLHGSWYGFKPHSHRIESPEHLQPTKDVPWKYEDLHELIKSGIYTFENADELRRQIMYPSERQAIENVITNTIMGENMDQQNINVMHLFSEQHLNEITKYIQKTWSFFTAVGNFSATLFGIWIAIRAAKYLLSVIINLKIISTLYGWNWRLFAAMGNTFTTYLIHKGKQRAEQHNVQLTAVTTDSIPETDIQEADLSSGNDTGPVRNPITLESLQRQTTIYPSLQ